MTAPVTTIRNIGPAMEQAFHRAGIETADQLRTLGVDAAYQRLIETGTAPHFIGFYALAMGLQGRPWNDCQGAEKTKLRERFDAICKANPKPSALAAELDALGVRL